MYLGWVLLSGIGDGVCVDLEHSDRYRIDIARYNGKTGLMLCCPLTTQIKGYPFEVAISGQSMGVVLSDQVKSLDWRARKARFKGRICALELAQARANAIALLGGG